MEKERNRESTFSSLTDPIQAKIIGDTGQPIEPVEIDLCLAFGAPYDESEQVARELLEREVAERADTFVKFIPDFMFSKDPGAIQEDMASFDMSPEAFWSMRNGNQGLEEWLRVAARHDDDLASDTVSGILDILGKIDSQPFMATFDKNDGSVFSELIKHVSYDVASLAANHVKDPQVIRKFLTSDFFKTFSQGFIGTWQESNAIRLNTALLRLEGPGSESLGSLLDYVEIVESSHSLPDPFYGVIRSLAKYAPDTIENLVNTCPNLASEISSLTLAVLCHSHDQELDSSHYRLVTRLEQNISDASTYSQFLESCSGGNIEITQAQIDKFSEMLKLPNARWSIHGPRVISKYMPLEYLKELVKDDKYLNLIETGKILLRIAQDEPVEALKIIKNGALNKYASCELLMEVAFQTGKRRILELPNLREIMQAAADTTFGYDLAAAGLLAAHRHNFTDLEEEFQALLLSNAHTASNDPTSRIVDSIELYLSHGELELAESEVRRLSEVPKFKSGSSWTKVCRSYIKADQPEGAVRALMEGDKPYSESLVKAMIDKWRVVQY